MSLEWLQWLRTICFGVVALGTILIALGTWGQYYFSERIEARKQQQQAEIAAIQTEHLRRSRILFQLRQLYIASHDGISPEMMSGVAPLPKDWVEEKLSAMGETWRQDQYY